LSGFCTLLGSSATPITSVAPNFESAALRASQHVHHVDCCEGGDSDYLLMNCPEPSYRDFVFIRHHHPSPAGGAWRGSRWNDSIAPPPASACQRKAPARSSERRRPFTSSIKDGSCAQARSRNGSRSSGRWRIAGISWGVSAGQAASVSRTACCGNRREGMGRARPHRRSAGTGISTSSCSSHPTMQRTRSIPPTRRVRTMVSIHRHDLESALRCTWKTLAVAGPSTARLAVLLGRPTSIFTIRTILRREEGVLADVLGMSASISL